MLVSAIMPTRGRQQWAAQAVKDFLSQTYQDKELVIVDDEDDPSFEGDAEAQLRFMHGIQYHRCKKRVSVGFKRNMACSRSTGGPNDAIVHWDSDDHSEPERIEDQATRLVDSGFGLTGYHSMRFYDVDKSEWWKYRGHPKYVLGTSMMYTRKFWKENPFPDLNVGEDGEVVGRAARRISVDAGDMMWARTHSGNTAVRKKVGEADCWVKL